MFRARFVVASEALRLAEDRVAASAAALAAAKADLADFRAAQRPQIAFHEAGHCVAYLLFGHALESASVVSDGRSVGRAINAIATATVIAGEYAAILIAGRVAQEKYLTQAGLPVDPSELDEYARGDIAKIHDLHQRLDGCRLDMFLALATSKAAALLEANWPAVERVAAELLAHGTLTGAQIAAAYRYEEHANAA
jgi:ATP-dependent Zn protease